MYVLQSSKLTETGLASVQSWHRRLPLVRLLLCLVPLFLPALAPFWYDLCGSLLEQLLALIPTELVPVLDVLSAALQVPEVLHLGPRDLTRSLNLLKCLSRNIFRWSGVISGQLVVARFLLRGVQCRRRMLLGRTAGPSGGENTFTLLLSRLAVLS